MPAIVTLLAFLVSLVVLQLLLTALRDFARDEPNARSLHARPVPRTGGIAVLAGAAVSLAFGGTALALPLTLALALAVVSFIDDLRSLPVAARLAAHLAAAAVLVLFLLPSAQALELAVLAVAVVWLTNLYNFMDGSDGLAGGMSVIGFGAYAVAAAIQGDVALLAVCAAIAAASAAFLVRNFHPARVFLGDVGSIPLGFLAAALGLAGWKIGHWPLWFPLVVFAPFIADASLTLVRRAARRERLWHAHREHYYQRLVRLGAGHRGTALRAYGVMLICAGMALYARDAAPATQAVAAGVAALVLAGSAVWIDVRWARRPAAEASG